VAKTNTLSRSEQARADAASQFSKVKQAEAAAWRERDARHEADMEKMIRLRALRLQKEAADKEAAAAAPPKPPAPRKRAALRPAQPASSDSDDNT
jgi:predicted RNA-binding protein with PUA-like domain